MPATASAFTVETPKSSEEFNQQQAEEATRKAQEQKAAEEQKVAEERKAAEEHKAAEERSQREAAERQHQQETEQAEAQAREEAQRKAKEAAASQCVVPSLKGDSLDGARSALRKAHCKLGRVTAPHGGHGALVVTGQSLKRGTKHPGETAVRVTLGAKRNRG
jgi:hypothetical protein